MYGKRYSTIIRAMNASDLLLLPSLHEGSSNALKDAMACGLPVVAAPVGDCEELLRYCHPSAIAERTEEDFTEAASRVLAIATRSNGRNIIRASLTDEAIARRIIRVYEETLKRRTGAAPRRAAPRTRSSARSVNR